jgi:hypothetical protein
MFGTPRHFEAHTSYISIVLGRQSQPSPIFGRITGNNRPLSHLAIILRQVPRSFSVRSSRDWCEVLACKGRALTRPILRLCSESVSRSIRLSVSLPRDKFALQVYADGEVWVRVLCAHGICARNSSGSGPTGAQKNYQVVLKYLGTVGNQRWSHLDSDRSMSVANQRTCATRRRVGRSLAGDTRRTCGWGDAASPDLPAIDSHIERANCVLVTHTS